MKIISNLIVKGGMIALIYLLLSGKIIEVNTAKAMPSKVLASFAAPTAQNQPAAVSAKSSAPPSASSTVWTKKSNGLDADDANCLLIHSDKNSLVFVGTDNGIYRSFDAGETFERISILGMPAPVVNDLYVSPDQPQRNSLPRHQPIPG